MQERERIQRELLDLQSECVKEYFSAKLEAITSKEVVSDILKGFIQIANVQFIQSITQSILQAKDTNKSLRREIENLKYNNLLQLQQLQAKLTEERDLVNERKYNETIQELKMKINNQIFQIQEQNTKFNDLNHQNGQLKNRIIYLQEVVKTSDQNLKLMKKEKETVSSELSGLQLVMEQREQEQRRQNCLHIKQMEEETQLSRTRIAEAEKTILLLKEGIQSKKIDIQTLQNDLFRLTQEKYDIESRSKDYEVLSSEFAILKMDKVTIEEQHRSSFLANKYLREENEFLRQEILSFRQIQIVNLNGKLQSLATESSKEIETLNIAKINLQQQLKQEIQCLTQTFQLQITDLQIDIQELKTFLSSHKEQLSEAKSTEEEMAEDIKNLKQQNKCLHEQVKLHFQQNQVHQGQLKCFEGEVLKVNQDCRAQLDTFKQTYEINWNSLNEELIEERFKCKQLQGELASLTEELSLQQEKEKFYSMYIEEISHLKRQLQVVGSSRKYIFSRAQLRFEDNKTKFYYFMSKINEQLKTLKNENKQLKTKFVKQAAQYKDYFQQTISYLFAKVKEESLKCSYCQHQKYIKGESKHREKRQLGFEKTIPKVSSNETPSLSNLKKTLKNVQQRYQAINQQNRFYNDHITSMMKST